MAAEGEVREEVRAHERGYSLFVAIMKWGTILSFILAAIVVILIAS
jgi:hypothetical protein